MPVLNAGGGMCVWNLTTVLHEYYVMNCGIAMAEFLSCGCKCGRSVNVDLVFVIWRAGKEAAYWCWRLQTVLNLSVLVAVTLGCLPVGRCVRYSMRGV